MIFLFFHSMCVLEEQNVFLSWLKPVVLIFGMKADDVVHTFVLLNMFRANLGQHF